uniref:A-kinase anchor protein 17A n=1 Tax=Rhizophora mucronata TaxID=61149 RepID=A0A2P2J8C0_RHIMU
MDGFFQNSRSQTQEKGRTPGVGGRHHIHELPRNDSHFSRHMPDDTRRKKFKVRVKIVKCST